MNSLDSMKGVSAFVSSDSFDFAAIMTTIAAIVLACLLIVLVRMAIARLSAPRFGAKQRDKQTCELKKSAQSDTDLEVLLFAFFKRFSRFEFALKEQEYLLKRKPGSRAEPDWNKFIKDNETSYELCADAMALIQARPKQQVVAKQGLTFVEIEFDENASDLRRIVTLVKTVRNNLFHGGKSDKEGWDAPVRIRTLVETSIKVLDKLAVLGDFEAEYKGEY